MPDISPFEHDSLYRGIKDQRWFAVPSEGFKLRPANKSRRRPNETALSVIVSANCTKHVCDARQHTCFGEFVLETSAVVRRWRVELTSSNHARIHGLPLHGSDEVAIEDAATDLAALIVSVQNRPQ